MSPVYLTPALLHLVRTLCRVGAVRSVQTACIRGGDSRTISGSGITTIHAMSASVDRVVWRVPRYPARQLPVVTPLKGDAVPSVGIVWWMGGSFLTIRWCPVHPDPVRIVYVGMGIQSAVKSDVRELSAVTQ